MFKTKIIALKDGLLDFKVYAEEDGKETYFNVFSAGIDKSITEPEITNVFRNFAGNEFSFMINGIFHFTVIKNPPEVVAYFEDLNRRTIIEPMINVIEKNLNSDDLDMALHYIVNIKHDTNLKAVSVYSETFVDATNNKMSIIHVWLKDQAELVFKVDNGKVSLDKIHILDKHLNNL